MPYASSTPPATGPHPDRRAAHHGRGQRDVRARGRPLLRPRTGLGNRPYVDLAVLEQALLDTGADAVWPGWGFVAEDPSFVDLCDKHGVTFIGPSAEAMRRLGDKIGSKLIAEEVGVPVAPWSRGAVDTLEDALEKAAEHRLPADAQGDRRWRWPRHPDGRLRHRPRGRLPAHQRRGPAVLRQRHRLPGAPGDRRPPRRGAADRRQPRHRVGARRTRLLDPAPQPEGHRGVVLAAAQRGAGRRAQGRRPSGSPWPWGTSARAPSSSSTTPASRPSPSSRSTPASRSSTRSPRPPPASTWSRRRSTWRRAAGSRGRSRPSSGTRSRPGSTPRTPTATSRPRPAASSTSTCRPARASGSTPGSPRATPSRPTSTR